MAEQLGFFPRVSESDPRPPETITWNPWCGCTKVSEGCRHCYMYRRFESVGRDPAAVSRTQSFGLPVKRLRTGEYKGMYKVPCGSRIFTCFSSDFFHRDADDWRGEAWDMMLERRDCTFFMITKRPERILEHLPADGTDRCSHITIAVTCEDQRAADKRLPIYLELPLLHRSVMVEPMLSPVDLRPYLRNGLIESVSAGGESGPMARSCDYSWVLDLRSQCVENGVSFSYHQTGARLIRNGREYSIPRRYQHIQAKKAHLDYDPMNRILPDDVPVG